MATKELIFDMDGTIADLYSVEGWLEKLRAENVEPYAEARPLYDMDSLAVLLNIFRDIGYKIVVVSWGAKEATRNYNAETRKTKIKWLQDYGFPYDAVHVVKYGTPKSNFITSDVSILIDDNKEVRDSFLNSKRGKKRLAIDATRNILTELADLLAVS